VLWLAALLLSIALHVANLRGLLPANSVYSSPALPLVIAVSSFSTLISRLCVHQDGYCVSQLRSKAAHPG
jgi:hypothetical protein